MLLFKSEDSAKAWLRERGGWMMQLDSWIVAKAGKITIAARQEVGIIGVVSDLAECLHYEEKYNDANTDRTNGNRSTGTAV